MGEGGRRNEGANGRMAEGATRRGGTRRGGTSSFSVAHSPLRFLLPLLQLLTRLSALVLNFSLYPER